VKFLVEIASIIDDEAFNPANLTCRNYRSLSYSKDVRTAQESMHQVFSLFGRSFCPSE
jgi:hypothetical protein